MRQKLPFAMASHSTTRGGTAYTRLKMIFRVFLISAKTLHGTLDGWVSGTANQEQGNIPRLNNKTFVTSHGKVEYTEF